MDENRLAEKLASAIMEGWNVTPTGSGFLVSSNWHWPNRERIEIYVRFVGEREDLYLVTDGGDIFNFLFSQGIDLTKDDQGMKTIQSIAEHYEAQFVDFQIVKGANEEDLGTAIRMVLEAVKDASLVLWHKLDRKEALLQ